MSDYHQRNGLTNKELLNRILDEIASIHTKLDSKVDREEILALSNAVQTDALAAKQAADNAIGIVQQAVRKKVGRGELFGWLTFTAGIVGMLVGVVL